jgi:DNA-binding NtrC family response regulator
MRFMRRTCAQSNMNPGNITIAVLDRNAADLATLASHLEDAGYRVLTASTQAHVERFLTTQPVNLVVKGFDATQVDPLPFLARVSDASPDTVCILCGDGGTIHEAVEAIEKGAADYLPKPVIAALLLEAVRKALGRQALVASDPGLRRSLKRGPEPDFFVGSSPAMKTVSEGVAQVAPAAVSVLISGESGTGKELVARALHEQSPRHEGPFVALNCAGLPDSLIESELFGHVRGAFTGAIADRPGAFATALHGTLFLDEVGDLSLKGQGDLLRVLEDGFYRPVGSMRPKRADVRVVAATHRDLRARVAAGLFREDLLYRLNVVELRLPPLRDRTEDIPALVDSFHRHFSARHDRRPKTITPGFLEALEAHPWPGNVRELRNLVERLVITVRGNELLAGHAPQPPATPGDKGGRGEAPLLEVYPGMSLAQVESALILATLEKVTPNRLEAARLLGLSPRTLHYRLRQLGHPRTRARPTRADGG